MGQLSRINQAIELVTNTRGETFSASHVSEILDIGDTLLFIEEALEKGVSREFLASVIDRQEKAIPDYVNGEDDADKRQCESSWRTQIDGANAALFGR